jgi:hypothetical protein
MEQEQRTSAPKQRRFDPRDMSLRGRIGAFALHARHDPRETTKPARAAFLARFEAEVDPERRLPEEERRRRAHAAMRAHMARLARKRVMRAIRRRPRTPAPGPASDPGALQAGREAGGPRSR